MDDFEYIHPTVRAMRGDKAPEPFDSDQYYYEEEDPISQIFRWFNLE
jgi:hypothetical protein